MNGLILLIDSVLMQDEDDWAMLPVSIRADGTNLDLHQLVVVDTSDIDSMSCSGNDVDVATCNATIGSIVDQSSMMGFCLVG
jgi:hypothetical protein